mgnify:CR=1 FL=1
MQEPGPNGNRMDDREKALREIAAAIDACRDCDLYQGATRGVPGEGDPYARVMFIGEGPGFHEDRLGRPFVGQAGQFLDQLIQSIGLQRRDVFIANVVKHRPPNNRDPLPGEIAACKKWLDRQVEIIRPRVIVTLGRYSMNRYFPGQSISRIHGQPRRLGDVWVIPMYHPAAALHQASLRRTIEADFHQVRAVLDRLAKEEATEPPAPEPEPQQMRLL